MDRARGVRGSAISGLIESLNISGSNKVYILIGVCGVMGNIFCVVRLFLLNGLTFLFFLILFPRS